MEGQSGTVGSRAAVCDGQERETSFTVSRAVKRAQEGDNDAFAFLYARFADDICGYARSIVHDYHEAEDVTQQVFAKLMRVIGKYREQDVPFFAWMLRVTRNVAVDQLGASARFRSRRCAIATPIASLGGPSRSTSSQRPCRLYRWHNARCSCWRHLAGLTPGEIADRTGKTEGSITACTTAVRRALIEELRTRGAGLSPLVRCRRLSDLERAAEPLSLGRRRGPALLNGRPAALDELAGALAPKNGARHM